MADMQLKCIDCGNDFTFLEKEQSFFAQKGLSQPKRCKDCRVKKRMQRDQNFQGNGSTRSFRKDGRNLR